MATSSKSQKLVSVKKAMANRSATNAVKSNTSSSSKSATRPLVQRATDRLLTADNIRNQNSGSTNSMDQWRAANADRIAGLAEQNNVDTGVAEAMLKSNIRGDSNYAGGGVMNQAQEQANLNRATTAAQANTSNDYLNKLYEAQRKALQGNIDASLRKIDSYRDSAKADYEAQQRANYIAQQQAMNGLNDYLAAMGLNGGAAESTAQGLAASYLNNRAEADRNYNDTLTGINQAYLEAQASGNSDLANLAAQMYQSYAEQAAQDAQNQIAQARWQAEFDAAQQQYEDNLAQQEYANALQRAQIAAQYGDYTALNNLLGTSIGNAVPTYYGSYGRSNSGSNESENENESDEGWNGARGNYGMNATEDISNRLYMAYGGDTRSAARALANTDYSVAQKEAILRAYYNLI